MITASMHAREDAAARPRGFSTAEKGRLIVFGLVFWFLAAVLIGALRPLGVMDGGAATVALYLALVPTGWLTSVVCNRLAGNRPGNAFAAGAFATMPAAAADGLAVAWANGLYGGPGDTLAVGAAVILFGVGTILFGGVIEDARRG
jgi:hypothetical protein